MSMLPRLPHLVGLVLLAKFPESISVIARTVWLALLLLRLLVLAQLVVVVHFRPQVLALVHRALPISTLQLVLRHARLARRDQFLQ
jgi:uncharacterized membrane protein YesL